MTDTRTAFRFKLAEGWHKRRRNESGDERRFDVRQSLVRGGGRDGEFTFLFVNTEAAEPGFNRDQIDLKVVTDRLCRACRLRRATVLS
ncbi:MAG: hypothetical protein U0992_00045 [Planctomycetaceae bacterium]